MNIERLAVADLHPDPANARAHPERNIQAIRSSLARFGQVKPIVIDENNVVRAGNGTLEAAKQLGWDTVLAVRTTLAGSEATAYAIADNRTGELAGWDEAVLAETLRALRDEGFDMDAAGYDKGDLDELIAGLSGGIEGETVAPESLSPSLAERFGVPPFSVLDARQGYWQDRKRAWLALGIQSELGRGGGHLEGVRDRQPD